MLSEADAKQRIQNLKNAEEQRVAILLLNLGFTAVDFNAKIFAADRQLIGEIDSLFVFENNLLIIETTIEEHPSVDSIVGWFVKWSDDANIKRIFAKYQLSPRCCYRLFFHLARDHPKRISHNINQLLKNEKNKIIYRDEVERYEENFMIVGKWEKNNFLNFLKIKREITLHPVPAILFYVSGKPAYTFGLNATELLNICFISRRYKHELGFQRAIDKKKVERIQQAIERRETLIFPNSVLINSSSKLVEDKPPRHECPRWVTINLPQDYSSCKVIDGQHRLLGFSKVSSEIASSYTLPVVAFEELSEREEIDTFVIINSQQKRVDKNLVLILQADSNWRPGTEFFLSKIAVEVVKKLYESSCLAHKIFMGYADQKRSDNWVNLATLVAAIIRNKFVDHNGGLFQNNTHDSQTPYERIRAIFAEMEQINFPFFINSADKFFLTNRGLRILFRFVNLFYRNETAGNISISFHDTLQLLSKTINLEVKEELKKYYGEGGAKKLSNNLLEYL